MPITLTMPKLSPTMEEGTIAKWHKKEGDKVEAGDLLIEVSTDKATVEFNAIDSGFIRKILIKEEQEAIVNQPIAIMTETSEESIEGYQPEGETKKAAPAPQEKETEIKEGRPGTKEQETQAAKPAAPAAKPVFAPAPPVAISAKNSQTLDQGRILASPLARKLAKEKGLDLATVQGSGPRGRIMSRDLEGARSLGPAAGRKELPRIPSGTYEEIALSPVRKVIAQRLQEAKASIPHFYVNIAIDAEPLFSLREQLRANEVKLTYNDFVIRACALALQKHPNVNSGFNSANNTILAFKTVDISVAVSVESGLITPIVRYADHKSLLEISNEVKALSQKAKDGKLQPQEFQGGSFTISNLGMYGIPEFQAIINPPQAAILAVGALEELPVVRNGLIIPGKVMKLVMSVDHRVIDGVAAALFLNTLKGYLEAPAILLL